MNILNRGNSKGKGFVREIVFVCLRNGKKVSLVEV